MSLKDIYDQLKEPFSMDVISFKPGATSSDRAMALAYAEPRAYIERLNQLCPDDWQDDYHTILLNDRVFIECRLAIFGQTRTDVGEELLFNPWDDKTADNCYTTASAQAFKRACVKFGLGAYLYSLPQLWAEYDNQKRRFTDKGLAYLYGELASFLGSDKPIRTTSGGSEPETEKKPTQTKRERAKKPVKSSDDDGKKPSRTEPLTPEQIESAMRAKVAGGNALNDPPASQKQAETVASLFQKAFPDEEDPAAAYHTCLAWLWKVDSAKGLTISQASATIDWLKNTDSWELHPCVYDEAQAILKKASK